MASLFISRYQLKPEKREEFVRTLKAMYDAGREFIEKETNFCFYGFGRNPNEFVAIESWKSEDVVNGMRATDGFEQGFHGDDDLCSGADGNGSVPRLE